MLGRTLAVALAGALALFALAGCDATGSAQGGESMQGFACGADAGHTWSDLYTCYFGPTGVAGCSAMPTCHASCPSSPALTSGAQTSGFVCGFSKHDCYVGMTTPNCCGIGADDAGADGGAGDGGFVCSSLFPPVVPTGGASSAATTTLWTALAGVHSVPGLHNMPYDGSYTFTADDLARISQWITEGAPEN